MCQGWKDVLLSEVEVGFPRCPPNSAASSTFAVVSWHVPLHIVCYILSRYEIHIVYTSTNTIDNTIHYAILYYTILYYAIIYYTILYYYSMV